MNKRALPLALALALGLVPAQAQAQSGPVLVIGDSLEVGTGPHLRRDVAAVPVTVDARRGRTSSEGVRVLRKRLRPHHEVVVFDLGTNDDPSRVASFARNLTRVRDLAGERCLVLATLNRPPLNSVSVAEMNRTVRDFVDATPDARLVDWEGAVEGDRALLAADRVHATPAGYAARARLVAAAVEECFGAVDPPTAPRHGPAEPEPRPRREAGDERPRQAFAELLALTPYEPIARWVDGIVEVVAAASRDVGAVFGPQPPEVKLGAPSPGR